ncbi:MAG: excinuclease ABC subunit B, partial [Candidatus Portnoybacteria bacterium CG10_big_fil_rev_8_21_14_0_10_40_22]
RRLRSASPPRNDNNKTLQSDGVVEQLIRPTGLLDPKIFIRPTKNQVSDLIKEIKQRVAERQRVLVTTITKRLSEDLTDFLQDAGIKAQYLHSEIKTLERPEILRDLRTGKYDVLVGINLLREGLDLPEVSLVAILDADKEGFLRNATTLIQTMGRASRRLNGTVIMYADRITRSMKQAISETNRRRKIQENYNRKNHITPRSIKKEIRDNILPVGTRPATSLSESMPIEALKHQMKKAAKNLDFETAAEIRDLIKKIRQ